MRKKRTNFRLTKSFVEGNFDVVSLTNPNLNLNEISTKTHHLIETQFCLKNELYTFEKQNTVQRIISNLLIKRNKK